MSHSREIETDLAFGAFIREARKALGIRPYTAARQACIPGYRFAMLECGRAQKGITRKECEKLACVLEMPAKVLIEKAAGEA